MVKKLVVKKLKTVGKDSQLSATIRESAQQIWLAGLGAFAKAQQEGNKVFDALVRRGESIQQSTRKVAEDKVTEMAAKATGTWDKLEQVFENRVARSLHSLGVPTRDEVAVLAKRVVELKAAVDKLNAGASRAAKPKTVAAKPVRRAAPKAAPRKAAPRKAAS
ncbi:MAG: phasin family protein [Sulfuritalea sp.]|jgi:poly(hydroxyalkanoate) granule-associated protein|nr:phasin family protein [Sulfuritalea sp.]